MARDSAIENASLIDVESGTVLDQAVVTFREGRVLETGMAGYVGVPDGADRIDARGQWVLPGLVNLHGHFSLDAGPSPVEAMESESVLYTAIRAAGHARQALMAGVTTVRELGSREGLAIELRDAVERGHILGPRVYASGLVLTMTGGHGWYMGREADGREEMRKAVREQVKRGVNLIKIMATGGVARHGENAQARGFTVEEMSAAIDEAHRAGIRTTAHALTAEGVKDSVEAGMDCIEHGIVLDDVAVAAMREHDVPLVSTLSVHQALFKSEPGDPHLDAYMKRADGLPALRKGSFQRALAAGIRYGAGSDAGTVLNRHDAFVEELVQMVDAGVSDLDAIRAATIWAGEILGVRDVGRLTPGAFGDAIIVPADPTSDVRNLRSISMVVKSGQRCM